MKIKLQSFTVAIATLLFSAHSSAQIALGFDIQVTDPARLISAMDEYTASQTGQSIPGTAILSQYIANGNSPATHNLAVFYPTVEGMDEAFLRNALSEDWAKLISELGAASTIVLDVMFEPTGLTNGNSDAVTSELYASRWLVIDVTDEASFAAEWQELVNVDPEGWDVNASLWRIIGRGDATGSHLISYQANNFSTLLSVRNSERPGIASFQRAVNSISSVYSINMVNTVKIWTNQ